MQEIQGITKRYWTTGQVANMMRVKPSRIRFWITYFQLDLKRNRNSQRQFTQEDVDRIAAINSFVAQGYKLTAIKNKI